MLHRDIHIDFNHVIDASESWGLSDQNLIDAEAPWLEVHRALHAMAEVGQAQFIRLPYLEALFEDIQKQALNFREHFDTLVVLGIGGSALGAKAINLACMGPEGMGLGKGAPRLIVLDTLDPDYWHGVMDSLDLSRTLFNVVSKSGNTVETMAQFLWVQAQLKKRLGPAFGKHLVMTTDPESGVLRHLARERHWQSFEILKGVGGRFSVLSPVGMFPAAFLGLNLQEFAAGAQRMERRCQLEDLWTNPAAMLSVVIHCLNQIRGKTQLVVFNYAESLRGAADWFAQLWAESLGKAKDLQGKQINSGITPIVASGPRDQHSQMQLYGEGPADKMVMFWEQEEFSQDASVPVLGKTRLALKSKEQESLDYLVGKTFSQILHAEVLSTEQALKEKQVPNFKLSLLKPEAYNLGQLFFLMEVATVYVGGLLGVNPYDQPGVELGKQYLYGQLGRPGYEKHGGVMARKLKDKRYLV